MLPPVEELTAQGYDLTFGTNVVGHFLFLQLLYPLLLSAPAPGPARVVWTSSFSHYQVPGCRLDYATFFDGPARRNVKRGMFTMYAQSKLAQVTLSAYLARRAADEGHNVASIALDPGNILTEIFRGDKPWYLRLWVRPNLCSLAESTPHGQVFYVGAVCHVPYGVWRYHASLCRDGTGSPRS